MTPQTPAFDPSILATINAFGPVTAGPPPGVEIGRRVDDVTLSDEQQRVIDLAMSGKDIIVDATVGSGKALDDESRVPTPMGWRLVKDIRPGDYLFDRYGKPTRVKNIFPQGAIDAYEVVLRDGRRLVTSADHNWLACRMSTIKGRGRKPSWKVVTTIDMLAAGVLINHSSGFNTSRFGIPTASGGVEFAVRPESLPVHPYVLGAFIGNGCCTENYLALSSHTDEVPRKVATLLGKGITVRRRSQNNWTWDFFYADGSRVYTRDILGEVEDAVMCYSDEKYIPDAYMVASRKERFELVRGLMDTDGSIYPAGGRFTVRYSTTSRMLTYNFKDLLGSLGMVVGIGMDNRSGAGKYSSEECFNINVNVSNDVKHLLFSLERKRDMAIESMQNEKRRDYGIVTISEIVPLNERRPMTCFEVENDEHLFLADDYIVTHNTSTIQKLCNELKAATPQARILYLTYSKLLKEDAQLRVRGAKVQNYHGIVYPSLLNAGIKCGISESIATFNRRFKELSPNFETYDVLIIDEYQDITEEYAELLRNIKSKNPVMQVIMVGDMEQRVSAASRHNAQEFARSFCVEPEFLSFTQSFRIGSQMAKELSTAWNKPIKGVNEKQTIEVIGYNEAVKRMVDMQDRVGDILVLGKRNGGMTDALNHVEHRAPEAFNKNTVYASVRDSQAKRGMSPDAAIFTTFDSSKGLERDTCFIFDYTEETFDMRLNFPDSNPEVLRNVFLVAASRGKNNVFFVSDDRWEGDDRTMHDDMIGEIEVDSFVNLPEQTRPQYGNAFDVASMFHFKYVETVDEAYALLDVEKVAGGSDDDDDENESESIVVNLSDGLIDLSRVINIYQKYEYFQDFKAESELPSTGEAAIYAFESNLAKMSARKSTKLGLRHAALDRWEASLALVAAMTNYDRYAMQVDVRPSDEVMAQIRARLAEQLAPDERVQREFMLEGVAMHTRVDTSPITFVGVCDVVRDDEVWGVEFVEEFTHPDFLRIAMLAVMSGSERGVLWNIRTNERFVVRAPDRQRFLDAVVNCVSKQSYRKFGPIDR